MERQCWPKCCDCDEIHKVYGENACRPGEWDLFASCMNCGARMTHTVDEDGDKIEPAEVESDPPQIINYE